MLTITYEEYVKTVEDAISYVYEQSPDDQIQTYDPLIKSEIEHIIFDPTDPDRITIQCQSQQCTEYLYKEIYRYCIQYDILDDEILDIADRLRSAVWHKVQLPRIDRTFEVLTRVVQLIRKHASDEDKVFIGLNGDYNIHISYD